MAAEGLIGVAVAGNCGRARRSQFGNGFRRAQRHLQRLREGGGEARARDGRRCRQAARQRKSHRARTVQETRDRIDRQDRREHQRAPDGDACGLARRGRCLCAQRGRRRNSARSACSSRCDRPPTQTKLCRTRQADRDAYRGCGAACSDAGRSCPPTSWRANARSRAILRVNPASRKTSSRR